VRETAGMQPRGDGPVMSYRMALADEWRVAIVWTVGLAAVSAACLLLFDLYMHVTALRALMDAVPLLVRRFLDLWHLGTPNGFVDAILFGFVAPFAFMSFAIRTGSRLAARRADHAVVSPGRTPSVVPAAADVATLVTWVVVLGLAVATGALLGAPLSGVSLSPARLVPAVLASALLGLVVGLVTLIAGLLTRRIGVAAAIGTVVALGADALNGVALSVPPLASFRYASFAFYAEDGEPVTHGVPLSHLVALGAAGVGLAILAVLVARRDLTLAAIRRLPGVVPRLRPPALLSMVLSGFVLMTLVILADAVRDHDVLTADAASTSWLHSLASPITDTIMLALTSLGSTPVVATLLVAAGAILLRLRRRREIAFLVAAIGGSVVASEALKIVVHRARPDLAWAQLQPDFSFPSGHAMNALVFYLALDIVVGAVRGRRSGLAAGGAAIILSLGIGMSRVYLGYHWLSDVVGGWLAGGLWIAAVWALFVVWGAVESPHEATRAAPPDQLAENVPVRI